MTQVVLGENEGIDRLYVGLNARFLLDFSRCKVSSVLHWRSVRQQLHLAASDVCDKRLLLFDYDKSVKQQQLHYPYYSLLLTKADFVSTQSRFRFELKK